jgi:hypothetical protein
MPAVFTAQFAANGLSKYTTLYTANMRSQLPAYWQAFVPTIAATIYPTVDAADDTTNLTAIDLSFKPTVCATKCSAIKTTHYATF